MVLRAVVAPQEFKGSLTAREAAQAIEAGLRRALPLLEVELAPMADGGPGTLELLHGARGGELRRASFRGPLGKPLEAAWLLLDPEPGVPRTAVVEAASTAGLVLLQPAERDPARASTFGVGQQIRAAIEAGAGRIIVGVGGTGTNDGGAGAAQALGYRLLDRRGIAVAPGPLALHWLDRVDAGGATPMQDVEVVVAADVTSPLLGTAGATSVFGPQKGVSWVQAPRIEAGLARWAALCRRDLGVDIASLEGGGAGGGLAAGLAAVCGAHIESGAAAVAEAIGLRSRIAGADVVVTGEGRLDAQTARGKALAFVASLAAELGKPCYVVVGQLVERLPGLAGVEVAADGRSEADAMSRAAELVADAAARVGALLTDS
ncbi:MAG: glycerate kinase [Dehalococcoidia bacterium]